MTQQDHRSPAEQLPQLLERLGVVPGRWTIDATSAVVALQATYLFGSKTTATVAVTEGHVYVDDDRTTMTGEVTFDAASVRTGIGLRDRHLRTGRFLDVRRYPIIRFDLESAVAGTTSTLVVTGRLTVRDRAVPLEVEVEVQADGAPGFTLTARSTFDPKLLGIAISTIRRDVTMRAYLRLAPPLTQTASAGMAEAPGFEPGMGDKPKPH